MSGSYIAIVTAIVYFVIKFFETRFVKKEQPQMKVLFRDAILVGLCGLMGQFIYDQFAPLADIVEKTPHVFTNDPDF